MGLISCSREDPSPAVSGPGHASVQLPERSIRQVAVRFDAQTARRIEAEGPAALPPEAGVVAAEREFPDAGRFEARSRAAGLHRWYLLSFGEARPATKAAQLQIPGAESLVIPSETAPVGFFDDSFLDRQWALDEAVDAGIHVGPVWRHYTTGDPSVVVAVVDGGVPAEHPDLKGNLIPAGTDGSWNFIEDNALITDEDNHGAHVAGIISAVNGNSLGVCGVAGGNAGAGHRGVRILNCQIFRTERSADGKEKITTSPRIPRAIKWAADHGAVICNNSWTYVLDQNGDGIVTEGERFAAMFRTIDEDLKAAVDYFITYAGCDENGEQLPGSPMKGGLVVFAAGNDAMPSCAPGNYEPALAVGASDRDAHRTSFSNYGSWVDIAAPGKDILSTSDGIGYVSLSGTSMSAPYVCGIAALVASYCGGPGFTADALKAKLLGGARIHALDHDAQIGPLADALGAVCFQEDDVPEAPGAPVADSISINRIYLRWGRAVSPRGIPAWGYRILWANERNLLEGTDPETPGRGVTWKDYPMESAMDEAELKTAFDAPVFGQTGYIRIAGYRYGNAFGPLSPVLEVRTGVNHAPVRGEVPRGLLFSRVGESVELRGDALFRDPDRESLSFEAESGDPSLFFVRTDGERIRITSLAAGSASLTFRATDRLGARCTFSLDAVCREKGRCFDAYPNPVRSQLTLRTGLEEAETQIRIQSSTGATVFEARATTSLFRPFIADLGDLSPGRYALTVRYGGKTDTRTLVKL